MAAIYFGDYTDSLSAELDKLIQWTKRTLGEGENDEGVGVELTDEQIMANFEHADLEFGSMVNEAQAKSNLINILGQPREMPMNNILPTFNFGFLNKMLAGVGSWVGAGGDVDNYLGYITMSAYKQDYDLLTDLYSKDNLQVNNPEVIIQNVYHTDQMSPYDVNNFYNIMAKEFAMGSRMYEKIYVSFPRSYPLQLQQYLSWTNKFMKSNVSWERVNNILRIFPLPKELYNGRRIFIRYRFPAIVGPNPSTISATGGYLVESASAIEQSMSAIVTNFTNANFTDYDYQHLNNFCQQWIRNYSLALNKITLGLVRRKFQIPGGAGDGGGSIQLDGAALVQEGNTEKENLKKELKESLEKLTNVNEMLKQEAEKIDYAKKIQNAVPVGGFMSWG